ncbi:MULTISPECIES: cation diffusion facilitator family transporter [Paenibacillus]|uniref:Cation diffusion facilitator family transporter n=1 Tax=Paenibacillus pabuli TaxID=1472 RepID=A0A855XP95_9BACL|nr:MULTISPECIES: cation diffusion facilitator family transporter [Paenibacillus]PWW36079.1 cation diffusion facilitator family transporter [Paenibacillus pabuli]PXW03158.1 cation diffusion facilitator family transporter [Paenibacillus taichungensis]QLG40070.1 cation transporter [Paenibacillus sp. E222]RAI98062.1 cation diffusion facilitator family transporter [Paenibacillus pabuli]
MEQIKYDNLKLGEKGAIISIIAYIGLTAIKMMIGYMSNSEALKADGLNNATDIIASIAVLIGLRLAQRPADQDHTYGHWKAETVASLVASFIMMVVGLQVLYGAITSVFEGKSESPDLIAAWTGIFCAAVMYLVYRYNKRLALKIKSQAVMAAAKDNISDAWVSIGIVVGIIGSQFGLPWLDPLTAVAVGILICKTAWDIFREATHHLTDGFDEELIKEYRSTIANVDGVEAVKDLRARNYGNNAVVDVVILVRSDLDLQKAHDISTNVEDELLKEHEVYTVHVHVEPDSDEASNEVLIL